MVRFTDTGTNALRSLNFNYGAGSPMPSPFGIGMADQNGEWSSMPEPSLSDVFTGKSGRPSVRTPEQTSPSIRQPYTDFASGFFAKPMWAGLRSPQAETPTERSFVGPTPGKIPGGATTAVGITPTDRSRIGAPAQDLVSDFFQSQYDKWQAELAAEEDLAKAQYRPEIDRLADELQHLKDADVDPHFKDYYDQRSKVGYGLPAAPLAPSTAPEELENSYDDAEGELLKTFQQIDVGMGKDVVDSMVQDMRQYEGAVGDMLRTDLSNIGKVHDLNAKVSDAMAKAAYSNDILGAKSAQVRINAELDYKSEQVAAELERQKRALADSLDAIRRSNQFQAEELDLDTVVNARWQEMMREKGFSAHEFNDAKVLWDMIKEDQTSMTSETAFRSAATAAINTASMASFGFSEDGHFGTIQQQLTQQVEAGKISQAAANGQLNKYMTNYQNMLRTLNLGQMVTRPSANRETFLRSAQSSGMSRDQAIGLWGNMSSAPAKVGNTTGPQATMLRDMFTTREYVTKNWDDIIQSYGPAVDETNVYRGPGGSAFPIVGGGKYTSSFGYVRTAAQRARGARPVHQGVDIHAARGTPMVAPVNGKVIGIDYGRSPGNYVRIQAKDGSVHYMMHMDSIANNLKVGQPVTAGKTYLGGVGNTGNARVTSPHVHYEIRIGGKHVDPFPFLKNTGA